MPQRGFSEDDEEDGGGAGTLVKGMRLDWTGAKPPGGGPSFTQAIPGFFHA